MNFTHLSRNMDAAEENKLREKWFNTREEQKKQDGEDSDDSGDGIDEYSAGCELISLKDLFTVHLLKLVSAMASKLLGVDETEFKNMVFVNYSPILTFPLQIDIFRIKVYGYDK